MEKSSPNKSSKLSQRFFGQQFIVCKIYALENGGSQCAGWIFMLHSCFYLLFNLLIKRLSLEPVSVGKIGIKSEYKRQRRGKRNLPAAR